MTGDRCLDFTTPQGLHSPIFRRATSATHVPLVQARTLVSGRQGEAILVGDMHSILSPRVLCLETRAATDVGMLSMVDVCRDGPQCLVKDHRRIRIRSLVCRNSRPDASRLAPRIIMSLLLTQLFHTRLHWLICRPKMSHTDVESAEFTSWCDAMPRAHSKTSYLSKYRKRV